MATPLVQRARKPRHAKPEIPKTIVIEQPLVANHKTNPIFVTSAGETEPKVRALRADELADLGIL